MINVGNHTYFRYSGRVIEKEHIVYLGFTNSQVEFYVTKNTQGNCFITAAIGTSQTEEVNQARLRVFVDDECITTEPIVLDKPIHTYSIATLTDSKIHKITIIKITEAAMSDASFHSIEVENGTLEPLPQIVDTRIKAEFIGDSITCGYGVHGAPDSEYHIREEDGMAAYSYLTAKALNLNARYYSVSGYGMYCEYTGDTENTIPKKYPYTNWWVDKEKKYDSSEFIPELIVINLGTNDSGHLEKEGIPEKFVTSYVDFLKYLKSLYPAAKILCICGTLCTQSFVYIKEAADIVKSLGLGDIYTMEQPYHDVEHDGIASGHPTQITHQKDAAQLIAKIKEILNI